MLLCSVPPSEACKPPATKGSDVYELEKKKRAPTLSLLPLNSLSQLVVNWSSVYFPGLLTRSGPVEPGVPGIEGIRYPLGSLNRLFVPLKFKRFSTRGSMGVVVFPKNAWEMEAAERSCGITVKPGLLTAVPVESTLLCLVP